VKYDYLIVGAGLAGCVMAERLANVSGKKILLIDKRPHIGGNCYDYYDEHGILIHGYGPHLFHTNEQWIIDYLSKFTSWRQYEYRVLSLVNDVLVPMPINRKTVNMIFETKFKEEDEVRIFFEKERECIDKIESSEDYVVSRVGRRLYDLLYKNYTYKQWGIEAKILASSVCGRIPIRTSLDDRYFDDRFQLIPLHGYTEMFHTMINHPNIELRLNIDYQNLKDEKYDKLIYTGLVDEYFNYMHGKLPYRSIRFEYETFNKEFLQIVASIHYPNEQLFTRTIEFKHITGQHHPKTTIAKEYPIAEGEPYYPIPTNESAEIYRRYQKEAEKLNFVAFVGRMATYRYYNMDQVISQSMALFERIANGRE